MLEIRNVTKVYRSKTGEQVVALNNVSISFPETGMVFILGKSGSGKSTLLNVIGGLDGYDSGEFVIQGKSSKEFAGSDFDAYRNTFIGFIFQEYNILDDFSVGANIGLALELQGRKATDETINNILAQVDLANYANRKPNELSGGQKQRIAIARALVKDPQIIMADEPTGALDSNTGKQIFDTLKELSRRKLVLIVSHDRDFAERYADRIIELADGNVISDVTKHEQAGRELNEGIQEVGEKILRIKPGYRLTARDLDMINSYLAKSEKGMVLSGDVRVNDELRSAAGLSEEGGTTVFRETDPQKDVPLQTYDGTKTRFIRSRLPMKNAVRIGASGLKHKKFRLFMTILLSLVAFSMFGVADTMAAYKKADAAVRSIQDSHVDNASFSLSVRVTNYETSDGRERSWSYYENEAMNDEDIRALSEKSGVTFIPVFNGSSSASGGVGIVKFMKEFDGQIPAYNATLSGFAAMTADQIRAADLTVTGRMPENASEIALPRFIYDQFKQYGFVNSAVTPKESVSASLLTMDAAGGPNSIIGKHVSFQFGGWGSGTGSNVFTIVGIVETGFDSERYAKFLTDEKSGSNDLNLSDILLQLELNDALSYGFHTLGFVTQAAIDDLSAGTVRSMNRREIGIGTDNQSLLWGEDSGADAKFFGKFDRVADASELDGETVIRLDGTPFTALGEKEYLVSFDLYALDLRNLTNQLSAVPDLARTNAEYETRFGAEARAWAATLSGNCFDRCHCAAVYRYAEEHFAANESELNAQGIHSVEDYARHLWESGGNAEIDTAAQEAQTALAVALGADLGLDLSAAPAEVTEWYVTNVLYQVGSGPLSGSSVREWLARYYAGTDVYANGLTDGMEWSDLEKWIGTDRSDWEAMTADERKAQAFSALSELYREGNYFVSERLAKFLRVAQDTAALFARWSGSDAAAVPTIRRYEYDWNSGGSSILKTTYGDCTLAGVFAMPDDDYHYHGLLVSDRIKADVLANMTYAVRTERAEHAPGVWAFAIAPMPADRAQIRKLVDISYLDGEPLLFTMRNQVMTTLESFNSFIEVGAKVFLYIGIGFAVFSALLLMNFISVSISYKRHEIGILRAVGARSSDVFKIFFSESFIIALINYLLAVAATVAIIFSINRSFRGQGLNVTLLNFGPRQLVLMFAISLAVAAVASFLPVWNIARRRPIDAIRNR